MSRKPTTTLDTHWLLIHKRVKKWNGKWSPKNRMWIVELEKNK